VASLRTICAALALLAVTSSAASASHPQPASWCGADTTANLPDQTNAPRIKFVYAHAADMPNRLVDFNSADNTTNADRLQTGVWRLDDMYLEASGGTRQPRWDMASTADCPTFLDIERVSLPRNADAYRSATGLELLKSDIRAAVDPAAGRRDIFVFADQLRKTGTGLTILGIAEYDGDDRKGVVNSTQRGGKVVLTFSSEGFGIGSGTVAGTGLHELTHALGAVAASAPHAGEGGHCTDGNDVMCAPGTPGLTSEACPGDSAFDCNRDDYFNPSPPAGSYLATHHNVYDSVFLAPPGALTTPAAAPVAALRFVASSQPGGPTTMDAGASSDADGLITSYDWDTDGDGTFDRATGEPTTTTTARKGTVLRVRVTDEDGLTSVAEKAVDVEPPAPGDPPAPGGPPAPDTSRPKLSGISLAATRVRKGKAAKLRLRLSEAARVEVKLERLRSGRRVHKKCVRPRSAPKRARKCTRRKGLGVVARKQGTGSLTLKIPTRGLTKDRYELLITATDAAGNRARRRTVRFRIV
jgi:hypothetical protein